MYHLLFSIGITPVNSSRLNLGKALKIVSCLKAQLDSEVQERLSMTPKGSFMLENMNYYLRDLGLVSCSIHLEAVRGQKCYRDPVQDPSSSTGYLD